MEYDEVSQSITEMGRVKFYEIYGNNTSDITLEGCINGDPDNIVLGAQSEYKASSMIYKSTCYVQDDGFSVAYRRDCTVSIEPESNIVRIHFDSGAVPSTSKISIALLTLTALSHNKGDDLNIFYNYKEYKGVTQKVNYNTASRIDSVIKKHKDSIQIVTNGTGSINSAETFPKKYEPLISKLPLESFVGEGVFNSQAHTTERIVGGSYTLDTKYQTPYTTGYPNYMEGLGARGRGTPIGGMATSTVANGYGGMDRLLVSPMVEMVTNDTTKNFLPGELALKIETRYVSSSSGDKNQITNYDGTNPPGETHNSFDMFKIEGRPLIKVKSR